MILSSAILGLVLAQAPGAGASPPCFPPYIDQHLIFFPTGSAELDLSRAWRVKLAADYIETAVSTVTVHGRTDTVGSDAANLDLSRRRGQVVVEELVRLGVPRETITLKPEGESAPARPTSDDTAEALNRMVFIDYRGGSIPALKSLQESSCPAAR